MGKPLFENAQIGLCCVSFVFGWFDTQKQKTPLRIESVQSQGGFWLLGTGD